jgi:hypothetical protein
MELFFFTALAICNFWRACKNFPTELLFGLF